MKRTKYVPPSSNLSFEDLDNIRSLFTKEEIADFYEKRFGIINSIKFENYESRVLAEKMFKMGYLAAHAEFREHEEF